MKCPKCKKKLQTKRTLDGETFTAREKFCGKCKDTFRTIENFESNLQEQKETFLEKMKRLTNDYEKTKEEYDELRKSLKFIIKAGQKK